MHNNVLGRHLSEKFYSTAPAGCLNLYNGDKLEKRSLRTKAVGSSSNQAKDLDISIRLYGLQLFHLLNEGI